MSLFFVRWEINIEAGNALEAARQAREAQTRPGTAAVVFDVWAGYQPRGVSVTVDLGEGGAATPSALETAASALLAAFGGDTPDWLREEAAALERALLGD